MSYAIKRVDGGEYVSIGVKGFDEAQRVAKLASEDCRGDTIIVNEDDHYILACVVYMGKDSVQLSISTSGMKDTPWIGH